MNPARPLAPEMAASLSVSRSANAELGRHDAPQNQESDDAVRHEDEPQTPRPLRGSRRRGWLRPPLWGEAATAAGGVPRPMSAPDSRSSTPSCLEALV